MTILPALAVVLPILASVLEVLESIVTFPVEIYQAYSSLLRWAVDSVQDLFEDHGYWVVFFSTLTENTLLLGLIVPGALIVILAGMAAHDGAISIPLAIVLGVCGTIIGDTLSYCIGRYGWKMFGRAKFLQELSDKVREPLMRRGQLFIVFYHFAGYTRVIGPSACGLLRVPYRQWAIADYGGAVLWVICYFGIGYLLGVAGLSFESTDQWFRYLEWGILVLIAIWGFFFLRSHTDLFSSDRASQEPAAEEAEAESSNQPAP